MRACALREGSFAGISYILGLLKLGAHLVIRVLELLLSRIGTGSNGLGIVSGKRTRWVGMISTVSSPIINPLGSASQLRTLFIDTSDQQSDSKGS